MDNVVIDRVIRFLAPSVNVVCAYVCEIIPRKQEFLMDVMHHERKPCCFKDVSQMGGLLADCATHKEETGCVVPTDEEGVHMLANL
jgi:hypothetical protein